jgi:hypothetical protein
VSVSSHLTPQPEQRLWNILETMRHAAERAETSLAVLAAVAALESWALKSWLPSGAAVLAFVGLAPWRRLSGFLSFLDWGRGKQAPADSLVSVDDMVKYSHGELINRLDRYLGGGITATQYYEDLIGEALTHARLAARRRRLLKAAWILFALGQLGWLAR